MKTFICIAALFIVCASAKRCFKSDAKVGNVMFDRALKDCMGPQSEATLKTYKCMLKDMGVKEDATVQDIRGAVKLLLVDPAEYAEMTKGCNDKTEREEYLKCVELVLTEKCSDDQDIKKA